MATPKSILRAAAAIALLVVACVVGLGSRASGQDAAGGTGGTAPATPAPSRACRLRPWSGNYVQHVESGGLQRTAVVHVPSKIAGRPAPLLLGFHGSGGTGAFMQRYSGLSTVAGTAGFAAVYPSAAGPRWNLELSEDPTRPDDVLFVRRLIDTLGGRICFDKKRVYAAGVSNGGGMVALLGCKLSSRIAAIAAVAGGYGDLPACAPDRPVSVLEIHGTADQVVPYDGRDGRGAAQVFAAEWAARDECPSDPVRHRVATHTLRYDWAPCASGTSVAHIALIGGEHAWPGATPPDPGPPAAIAAAPVIWAFLAPHRLAPAGR
ncbi:MAG: polyhydroxybutyrate depolymerase [Thermoleophilaceae bacterium]|jgi:polyhydroxybutyrate depolymerase|nr:polyhydroxybutyrate depolymerase [Thermoleophilaceae bacterium]